MTGEDKASSTGQLYGKGPWQGPIPDDPRLDSQLLHDGDYRNVVDTYRYWSMDAIVADLDTRRHAFHVAIENWEHDFNIGSIVRTANAFAAAEVHIVGKHRWNRRGAMVTDRYQHIHYHEDAMALAAWADGEKLPIIGIDNIPGSVRIENHPLPEKCVLLFGQESTGLTPDAQKISTEILYITQYGSTRSMNAGAAAAIAMFAWAVQHA